MTFDMKPVGDRRRAYFCIALFLAVVCRADGMAHANPYLGKPGEPAVKVRIGACAITGGFIHLYTALDNRLFDKYGINAEHILVRGGAVAMAGLASMRSIFFTATRTQTSCASALGR